MYCQLNTDNSTEGVFSRGHFEINGQLLDEYHQFTKENLWLY